MVRYQRVNFEQLGRSKRMTLRGKTIDELRSELELIDRTIQALENLGRLRTEAPRKQPGFVQQTPTDTAVPRLRKPVQTH